MLRRRRALRRRLPSRPSPTRPTRRVPRPLTQHGQPAAGPEGQSGARGAQLRSPPPKPPAPPRSSPSTRSRVPRPKYWVSPSRPPTPAQKPACVRADVPAYLAQSAVCPGRSTACFGSQPLGTAQKQAPLPVASRDLPTALLVPRRPLPLT